MDEIETQKRVLLTRQWRSILYLFSLTGLLWLLPTLKVQAAYVDGIYVYHENDKKIEHGLLKRYAKKVKREGKTLTLIPEKGKPVRVTDIDSCEGYEDCVSYLFAGVVGNYFVVNIALWEGSDVWLISRKTGRQYVVHAQPHLSPDNKHIVSASPAEAYNKSGVFLWEEQGGKLIPRFNFEPDDYVLFSFVRWQGPNTIELTRLSSASPRLCPKDGLMRLPVRLVSSKNGWHIDDESMKSKVKCL